MKTTIRFGTDGWRAIIGQDFTVENVARVAEATAQWMLKQKMETAVVGRDTRFAGELFAETVCKILASHGIKCFLAKGIASTPMVSLGTVRHKAGLGIVITASHNPPMYSGFKLKGAYGGPLLPALVEEVERLIPQNTRRDPDKLSTEEFKKQGLIVNTDLDTMYCDHVRKNFDLEAIRNSGLKISFDAMFGAGQNAIKNLFPEAILLHCDENPGFNGQAPEPIHKNLTELARAIKTKKADIGIGIDGDADRLGVYDSHGEFVDSHHVILLLIKYLHESKGLGGKVVTAFSVSPKVSKLCAHYGLEQKVTKIGFKHIAGIMVDDDVLLGGEESGGIALKDHIPERDGIWVGLTILEQMAKTGRSLRELVNDIYEIVGQFAFERSDLHLQEEIKRRIVENCEKNQYQSFGEYKIQRIENVDGYKYFFNEDEWFMIRASGTEPVLRNYAQSSTRQSAADILKAAEKTLLQ